MSIKSVWVIIKNNLKLILILVPIFVLLPIPLVIKTPAASCAYAVILMSFYWMTEALPLAVTALLPMILFPILGIEKAENVAPAYFKDINMLHLGSLIIATAIEITRLHERVAIRFLMKFGSNHIWIMLGFMLITSFLSLWMSNTATTAIMLPIIQVVAKKLIESERIEKEEIEQKIDEINHKKSENNLPELPEEIEDLAQLAELDKPHEVHNLELVERISVDSAVSADEDVKFEGEERKIIVAFSLCCAYAATIGGTGSLVGTAPNLLLKGHVDNYHPDLKLDFLTFILFSLPAAIILLLMAWVIIAVRWLPKRKLFYWRKRYRIAEQKLEHKVDLKEVLREKYDLLGPIKWSEISVAIVFMIAIVLWVTRDFYDVPGWSYFFKHGYITDTIPPILATLLLFILPRTNMFKEGRQYNHLLDWNLVEKKFHWMVILLIGGSIAMADGFKVSGLSHWIGDQLSSILIPKKEVMLIIVILITALVTEFTSNTSVSAIFLPIVDQIAVELGVNPLYLLVPMTLCVNSSYMLPISAPTNAVAFASGHIRTVDMLTTGILLKLPGLLVVFMASNLWMAPIFDFDSYNATSALTTTPPSFKNAHWY